MSCDCMTVSQSVRPDSERAAGCRAGPGRHLLRAAPAAAPHAAFATARPVRTSRRSRLSSHISKQSAKPVAESGVRRTDNCPCTHPSDSIGRAGRVQGHFFGVFAQPDHVSYETYGLNCQSHTRAWAGAMERVGETPARTRVHESCERALAHRLPCRRSCRVRYTWAFCSARRLLQRTQCRSGKA
jgi:hypothetical protein